MKKDMINIAIVGCGGIAGAHLSGYDNLVKAGYDLEAAAILLAEEYLAGKIAE